MTRSALYFIQYWLFSLGVVSISFSESVQSSGLGDTWAKKVAGICGPLRVGFSTFESLSKGRENLSVSLSFRM